MRRKFLQVPPAVDIAEKSLERAMSKRYGDRTYLKGVIKDDLAKFIYGATKRKPMIIPMIMNV